MRVLEQLIALYSVFPATIDYCCAVVVNDIHSPIMNILGKGHHQLLLLGYSSWCRYRDHLAALYIVHPNWWFKVRTHTHTYCYITLTLLFSSLCWPTCINTQRKYPMPWPMLTWHTYTYNLRSHPTHIPQMSCWWFLTFTGSAVKEKVQYLTGVRYLYDSINPDQIEIPNFILEHDIQVTSSFIIIIVLYSYLMFGPH